MKHNLFRTGMVLALAVLSISIGRLTWARGQTFPDQVHGSIAWIDSLEKARERAIKEKKPILVDFYAAWCGPCQLMLKTTYKDKTVAARAKKFIPVLINVDKQPQVAEKYGISAIPTVVFLDGEGKILMDESGYHSASEFLKIMDAVEKQSRSGNRSAAH